MKKFDGTCMRGLTEQDNKIILEHAEQRIEMTIDEIGRVFNEGGIYIADAEEVDVGNGIYCYELI